MSSVNACLKKWIIFNEANNAEKFGVLHQHNHRIAVPVIYHEATSRRVLTMEMDRWRQTHEP